MKSFKSDNVSGVHPKIMQAIMDANTGHQSPYGEDEFTGKVQGLFPFAAALCAAGVGHATQSKICIRLSERSSLDA